MLKITWDTNKAELNLKKHNVSFEEAKSVFYDEKTIEFFDTGHSEEESRFLLLGMSDQFRLLLVAHCYRDEESIIRIISARKATKDESKHYR
ncbi:MAG TPA: hypothetical protein DD381_07280 [Lentisphaeria bacterium]|nr:MAG: hypothetical protein A2X47_05650 [Lentisphaerae bacterium GWF2_38_69]HBM16124.1 hypothetical protein [Lentisphaeria bacterium]